MSHNPRNNDSNNPKGKSQQQISFATPDGEKYKGVVFAANDSNDNDDDHEKMKKIHRDIERQRRKEVAILHTSLRSLLPLEYIKGKRSISDHMHEATNYIKHLQKKMKELSVKREELKKLSSNSRSLGDGRRLNNPSLNVSVRQACWGGVEIVISNDFTDEKELAMSRVLEILLQEGHKVIKYISTKVSNSVIYTIQSEVGDQTHTDLGGLEQKINVVLKMDFKVEDTLYSARPNLSFFGLSE